MSASAIRKSSDIEEARTRLLRLADWLDVDDLKLEACVLRDTVTEFMFRGFSGRQTRTKRRSLDPALAAEIRAFAKVHSTWSQDEIGSYFNCAGGRVSEALAGHDWSPRKRKKTL